MKAQAIDGAAARLGAETRAAVHDGAKIGHEKRTKLLFDHYADPNPYHYSHADSHHYVYLYADHYQYPHTH